MKIRQVGDQHMRRSGQSQGACRWTDESMDR
jgi:hypothetical protein